MTTALTPTPITNTARALVIELITSLQGTPAGEEHSVLLHVLLATIDSQWDDVESLRNANLGQAAELERTARYVEKIETKNSELMLALDASDRACIQLHALLEEERAKHGALLADEQAKREALARLVADSLGEIAQHFRAATGLALEGIQPNGLTLLPPGARPDTDSAGEPRVLLFPPCTGEASWEPADDASDATGWRRGQDHDGLLAETRG